MRYIPHALLILLVLLLPLAVSILIAVTAFACYTAIVWFAFAFFAPVCVNLTILEAAQLALKDIVKPFLF